MPGEIEFDSSVKVTELFRSMNIQAPQETKIHTIAAHYVYPGIKGKLRYSVLIAYYKLKMYLFISFKNCSFDCIKIFWILGIPIMPSCLSTI